MKQLLSLRVSSFKFLDHKLFCDFSTGAPRPLLPPLFRYPAFAGAYTLSHPGIRASKRLMSVRWVWAGMAADIAQWYRDCQHQGWALRSFPFRTFRSFPFKKENVTFFSRVFGDL